MDSRLCNYLRPRLCQHHYMLLHLHRCLPRRSHHFRCHYLGLMRCYHTKSTKYYKLMWVLPASNFFNVCNHRLSHHTAPPNSQRCRTHRNSLYCLFFFNFTLTALFTFSRLRFFRFVFSCWYFFKPNAFIFAQ